MQPVLAAIAAQFQSSQRSWDTMSEFSSGNIRIRTNRLAQIGDKVNGHKHNFHHTTIVFTGAVHVRKVLADGRTLEGDFSAPAFFPVDAGVEHEITATEPNTLFWCVYAHRNEQGDVVPEYSGWRDAYV